MNYTEEFPGVDPYDLARRSGLVPSDFGLGGMGITTGEVAVVDPEPYSKAALTIIATITNFFGFGSGRKEADQIVPIQNQVFGNVIQPIFDITHGVQGPSLSTQTLTAMLDAILAVKAKWLTFLHDTDWSDGRAATQAEAGLAPYFDETERKIRELLQTSSTSITQVFTGVGPIPGVGPVSGLPGSPYGPMPPVSTAGFSTIIPVVLGIGALIFFGPKLLKKGS